jgi:hypothetical protein
MQRTDVLGDDFGFGTQHRGWLGAIDPDVFGLNCHGVSLSLLERAFNNGRKPFLGCYPFVNAV